MHINLEVQCGWFLWTGKSKAMCIHWGNIQKQNTASYESCSTGCLEVICHPARPQRENLNLGSSLPAQRGTWVFFPARHSHGKASTSWILVNMPQCYYKCQLLVYMKMLHNITLTASGAHKYGQTALEYKHVFHLSRWVMVRCPVPSHHINYSLWATVSTATPWWSHTGRT